MDTEKQVIERIAELVRGFGIIPPQNSEELKRFAAEIYNLVLASLAGEELPENPHNPDSLYIPAYGLYHGFNEALAAVAPIIAALKEQNKAQAERIAEYEQVWGDCSRRDFLKIPVETRRKILKLQAQTLADNMHDSQAKEDLGMME